MLTSVQVYDALGVSGVKLPLYAPNSEMPYYIKDISGLGPVKAHVTSSNYANMDGGIIHNSRTEMRNIVMTVTYAPYFGQGQTVESLRKELYRHYAPKSRIRLRVNFSENGISEYVYIQGVVETHEPILFSKDPEVQISIICPKPYFYSPSTKVINGRVGKAIPVADLSSVETGFLFELTASSTMRSVRISNGLHRDILFDTDMYEGDKLRISTRPGNKFVERDTGSGFISDLDGITQGDLSMFIDPRIPELMVTAVASTLQTFKVSIVPMFVGL